MLGCSEPGGSACQVKADAPVHLHPTRTPSAGQPQGSEISKGPSVPDFLAVLCTPLAPGLPGEPVFLLSRLLKKLANTPSLAALSMETLRKRASRHWSTQHHHKTSFQLGIIHLWLSSSLHTMHIHSLSLLIYSHC